MESIKLDCVGIAHVGRSLHSQGRADHTYFNFMDSLHSARNALQIIAL